MVNICVGSMIRVIVVVMLVVLIRMVVLFLMGVVNVLDVMVSCRRVVRLGVVVVRVSR